MLVKRRLALVFFFLAMVLWLSIRGFASITIDGYTDATNDRFSNDPAFIMSSFNLSGIGQTNYGRWATAISNNVIISASHWRPDQAPDSPPGLPPPDGVFFYAGNDPTAVPVLRQIVSTQAIVGTDIFLGVLNAPLPPSIAHYAIASQSLSGPVPVPNGDGTFLLSYVNAGPYQGLNAYTFGLSPFDETLPGDNRETYNDQAVGRNVISSYSENVPFTGSDNDSLIMLNDAQGTANHVLYESLFQAGDSGGPTFVNIDGQLVLLGTNAFVFTNGSGSGINYLGNQRASIQSFIQLNAVPEPSSIGLLGLASLLAFSQIRRRTA